MKGIPTSVEGAILLEPQVFGDDRGYFYESFNSKVFSALLGEEISFVQDNHSKSSCGVLRGLHYQVINPQGKLVRVAEGEVFDVIVDLRKSSPSFGKWFGVYLSAQNRRQLWVPPGFAHGFYVTSDAAQFLYKTTDYYDPIHERTIAWDDKTLNIQWPLQSPPTLSAKDRSGSSFMSAELFE